MVPCENIWKMCRVCLPRQPSSQCTWSCLKLEVVRNTSFGLGLFPQMAALMLRLDTGCVAVPVSCFTTPGDYMYYDICLSLYNYTERRETRQAVAVTRPGKAHTAQKEARLKLKPRPKRSQTENPSMNPALQRHARCILFINIVARCPVMQRATRPCVGRAHTSLPDARAGPAFLRVDCGLLCAPCVGFGFSVRRRFALGSLALCRACAIAHFVSSWRVFSSVSLYKLY
jgi:hypothetical protein